MVATSNAQNISDGLDGLAGGPMMAYGARYDRAYFVGKFILFAFCMTVWWGGCFLTCVVQQSRQRFMMGDVGSFALGAGLMWCR